MNRIYEEKDRDTMIRLRSHCFPLKDEHLLSEKSSLGSVVLLHCFEAVLSEMGYKIARQGWPAGIA